MSRASELRAHRGCYPDETLPGLSRIRVIVTKRVANINSDLKNSENRFSMRIPRILLHVLSLSLFRQSLI